MGIPKNLEFGFGLGKCSVWSTTLFFSFLGLSSCAWPRCPDEVDGSAIASADSFSQSRDLAIASVRVDRRRGRLRGSVRLCRVSSTQRRSRTASWQLPPARRAHRRSAGPTTRTSPADRTERAMHPPGVPSVIPPIPPLRQPVPTSRWYRRRASYRLWRRAREPASCPNA